MATQKTFKQHQLALSIVCCLVVTSTSFIGAFPSPLSSSSVATSSSVSRDKIVVSSSDTKTTSTTSGPSQSNAPVTAAEAAAEAAAFALGGIKNGLDSALSIVPASINLGSDTSSSSTPAPSKVIIVTEPTTSTTTTTTSAPKTEEVKIITVATNDNTTVHKHSNKKIDVTDTLHKFDLFIDPVCEQLAKLTDKQIAKLLAQLKEINSLANDHDAIAKCFNEHKFAFNTAASELMSRPQLSDFCTARNAGSDHFNQWSACSARVWSPKVDIELDRMLKDRVEGAQAKAKHISGLGGRLNNVELSLIDSIVAHLHDEQVHEIASELANEQKKHEPQHLISAISHQKQQQHQVVGDSGKLSSSSPSSVEVIPSPIAPVVNHHDQIISASPLLSSSQQQHHEFLSTNLNQQHLVQGETPSPTGQIAASGYQLQETHLATIQHNQQQDQQIATTPNVVAGSEHTVIKEPAHPPVLVAGGQEQHLATGGQTAVLSASVDHVAAAGPPLVHPVQQQELVGGAAVISGTQTQQEASSSTASNTIVQQQQHQQLQQQQSLIQEQPANHLGNDLITLARSQVAEKTTTTTSTNSHQETVQIGSAGPTSPPTVEAAAVVPTISPVANFLLNSIDFATKAPLATVGPVAVIQPVGPAVVPIQPNVLPMGENPAINYGQHQQSTTVATNSLTTASIANSHDAIPQMTANPVVPIGATSAAIPQHAVTSTSAAGPADLALVPTVIPPASPVVLHQQHQPEILAGPSTIPAIVPVVEVPSTASVAATSSQHMETTSQTLEVLGSQQQQQQQQQHLLVPPAAHPPQIQQAVSAAPLVEAAVIKNVNTALDVMASTNSSGIVSLAPSNSTNTTLFVSNSGSNTSITATTATTSTTSTTTQAPITILVKTEEKATTSNRTVTTTAAPKSNTTTTSTTTKPEETKAPANSEKKSDKKRKKIGHDERLAKLRSKFGAAQVHDVIVIGEHEEDDDMMEDYDDHSEHHEHGDEHEHSDHHDDGSLILNHSSSSSHDSSSSSSSKKHEESSQAPKASAEITTVVEVHDDSSIEEHKEHEHLLAGLKSGDVVHVDAGEA